MLYHLILITALPVTPIPLFVDEKLKLRLVHLPKVQQLTTQDGREPKPGPMLPCCDSTLEPCYTASNEEASVLQMTEVVSKELSASQRISRSGRSRVDPRTKSLGCGGRTESCCSVGIKFQLCEMRTFQRPSMRLHTFARRGGLMLSVLTTIKQSSPSWLLSG